MLDLSFLRPQPARFAQPLIAGTVAMGLVACGGGGGGGSPSSGGDTSSVTLSGSVTDAPVDNAQVKVLVGGNQVATTTAGPQGSYSVDVEVDSAETDSIVELIATQDAEVELASAVGAFDSLKNKANNGTVDSETVVPLNVTNVTTANHQALEEKAGDISNISESQLNTYRDSLSSSATQILTGAASIKAVLDDSNVSLPACATTVRELLKCSQTEFGAWKNNHSAEISNAKTEVQGDPNLAVQLPYSSTASGFVGESFMAFHGQEHTVISYVGKNNNGQLLENGFPTNNGENGVSQSWTYSNGVFTFTPKNGGKAEFHITGGTPKVFAFQRKLFEGGSLKDKVDGVGRRIDSTGFQDATGTASPAGIEGAVAARPDKNWLIKLPSSCDGSSEGTVYEAASSHNITCSTKTDTNVGEVLQVKNTSGGTTYLVNLVTSRQVDGTGTIDYLHMGDWEDPDGDGDWNNQFLSLRTKDVNGPGFSQGDYFLAENADGSVDSVAKFKSPSNGITTYNPDGKIDELSSWSYSNGVLTVKGDNWQLAGSTDNHRIIARVEQGSPNVDHFFKLSKPTNVSGNTYTLQNGEELSFSGDKTGYLTDNGVKETFTWSEKTNYVQFTYDVSGEVTRIFKTKLNRGHDLSIAFVAYESDGTTLKDVGKAFLDKQ